MSHMWNTFKKSISKMYGSKTEQYKDTEFIVALG